MKKAVNQSVLTLILNGVAILSMLFLMVLLLNYRKANSELNLANQNRYELTYNANRFMNGSAYLTNEVRAFAATAEQTHYDNYWNEVNQLKNREIGVAAMQEIGITQEEQAMIDEMASLSNALVPLEEESMTKVQEGKIQEAIDYVYGEEYNESIAKINALKEQFLDALDDRSLSSIELLEKEVDKIRVQMIIALIVVGIIQLLNIIITRVQILRPVLVVRNQMGEISQGNLSAEFPLESNTSEIGMLVESIHETKRELKKYIHDIDAILAQMADGNMDMPVGNDYRGEFRPIQDAMRQILDSLNDALSQINLTAEQVSEQSRKMASDAQTLSSGAVQQASAVEELSSSIQEISTQVERTSEDANNAREASGTAMGYLKECDQKMGDLMSAMEDISKASNRIGGIIKTIEDIAFQTNILALNASVEAARAGEAGKGFAVVADEVRSLANKSSESAHSITEMIEDSIKLVEYGTSLSTDASNVLGTVVVGAKEATSLMVRIAESAMLQSESLKQLTLGMEQISEVVQMNATTAEQSALSAGQLYNEAEELKVSVHQFKLRGRGK